MAFLVCPILHRPDKERIGILPPLHSLPIPIPIPIAVLVGPTRRPLCEAHFVAPRLPTIGPAESSGERVYLHPTWFGESPHVMPIRNSLDSVGSVESVRNG